MILSFGREFETPIVSGHKRHTIREDGPGRWHEGRTIDGYTGSYKKGERRKMILKTPCTGTQKIKIQYTTNGCQPLVWVEGRQLGAEMVEKLAFYDGFEGAQAFFDWFNKDFEGKLIHWKPKGELPFDYIW